MSSVERSMQQQSQPVSSAVSSTVSSVPPVASSVPSALSSTSAPSVVSSPPSVLSSPPPVVSSSMVSSAPPQPQQLQQSGGGERDVKKQKVSHEEKEKTASLSSTQPGSVTSATEKEMTITYKLYTNDDTDEALIALTTLKEIFSKQLPKMPKEYIVRLVFDLNHYSLAILKNGVIIGGICYRPYFEQHFAEIAFCAVSGTEQVRGFGTVLMNNTKKFVQQQGIEYFLTFADNYAIGYFQKQGFSKHIGLSKERWLGWIKEYDGGTLMECYIHPGVDYLRVPEMVSYQRKFLHDRILSESLSHVVHPGVDFGGDVEGGGGRESRMLLSILEAPGVAEAGWTNQNALRVASDRDRNVNMAKVNINLKNILDKVRSHEAAWPFLEAVDKEQYPDYYEVIKNPIDLCIISDRLNLQTREGARRGETNSYYRTKEMLRADLLRMAQNCKLYNDKSSEYYHTAEKFERYISTLFGKDDAKGNSKGASGSGDA